MKNIEKVEKGSSEESERKKFGTSRIWDKQELGQCVGPGAVAISVHQSPSHLSAELMAQLIHLQYIVALFLLFGV